MATQSLLYSTFFLLVVAIVVASSRQIIKTLPGFDGDLPFKLETGYVGVGELDDVQLFYYFIESERSPGDDPLVLWLTGGPGCSAFSGLVYEIGPLSFDYENSKPYLPNLTLNPYSWTKVANIIFLDAPVGTGFSYAKTWQGYSNMDDILSAAETYSFLRKWLIAHPKFVANPLYISGDSYSGIIVPIVVQHISDDIDAGNEPRMNLKGYTLGNPATYLNKDINSRVWFAYLNALISQDIYESAKRNCKGEYVDVDPSNGLCIADLQNIKVCIGKLFTANIYEPQCSYVSPAEPNKKFKWDRSSSSFFMKEEEEEEDSINFLFLSTDHNETAEPPRPWCRNYNCLYSYSWANDIDVQRALGIRGEQ
ncbi:putative Serine carboxypeptidase [Melia azedarach]|uniref:Serine carboxypeptidase n=1 Tax=Melia azedarach TaxID=155640 RepID=A0ACC1XXG1_MELAZ|nr:putative Serine carboxypeptidase [Melia azedarach]